MSDRGAPLPVTVNDLTYRVGGQVLLDIPSLEISQAWPTMILGPNGAGKSLLLRLLHGLIAPTSGTIRFNGQMAGGAVGRRQAMVFQKPVLLRRTVAANVNYALKVHDVARAERKGRISALLEQGGLSDHAGQPARTLSGGEQQRLAIVRALASDPDVLFLDEPTSSLDPSASLAIEDLIARAARGGAKVIMITHDLGLAQRLAGDIVFLHHGRVCEQTRAPEFFAHPKSHEAQAYLASKLVL